MPKDYSDYEASVSREPILGNVYSNYVYSQDRVAISGKSTKYFQYSIPDDGYRYTLLSYYWGQSHYVSVLLMDKCIYRCFAGFLLDQTQTNYIWCCAGWMETQLKLSPSKQGALSMVYPGAFVMSTYNSSSRTGAPNVLISMYRKLVEA